MVERRCYIPSVGSSILSVATKIFSRNIIRVNPYIDRRKTVVYNRDIETSAEAMRQHNANQMKNASDRMKTVKAKMKLKKEQKRKE